MSWAGPPDSWFYDDMEDDIPEDDPFEDADREYDHMREQEMR